MSFDLVKQKPHRRGNAGMSEQDKIRRARWQRFLATIDDEDLRDYMESCRDIFEPFMDDDPAAIEYENARNNRRIVIEQMREKYPGLTSLAEIESDYIVGRLSDKEFADATYKLILDSFPAQGTA